MRPSTNNVIPMKRIFYNATLASLTALLLWQSGLAVWAPQVSGASGVQMAKAGKNMPSFSRNKAPRPYPGSRGTKADRGKCPKTNLPMMAIMPTDRKSDKNQPYVWASTLDDFPLLWVYMPYNKSEPTHDFNLKLKIFSGDVEEKLLGESSIDLPKTAGIMPIPLPGNVTLAVEKSYHWTLSVTCLKDRPVDNRLDNTLVDISAWIYRAKPPLGMPASERITIETAKFYADRGLWLDTLYTALVLMNRSDLTPDQFQDFLKENLVDLVDTGEKPDLQQSILEQIIKQNVLLEQLNAL
jgi:hypothetical protein